MSKEQKAPKAEKPKGSPGAMRVTGVYEAEKYQAANPSHRCVAAYRETMHGPKVFEFVKE